MQKLILVPLHGICLETNVEIERELLSMTNVLYIVRKHCKISKVHVRSFKLMAMT